MINADYDNYYIYVDTTIIRVDFEREIEWLRAKRDEVWQRVALLERVAGGSGGDFDDYCDN